jgi:hypothetical protein
MKKFIPKLLLLAGVAITFAACSKKNSDKPGSEIVGKWSIAADTVRLYDNTGKLVETDVNNELLPTDYIQFNQDGSGTNVEFGEKISFNYTVNGTLLNVITKSTVVDGVKVDADNEDITIKHLDSHTLYTYEEGADTVNTTVYTSKESIHFTK